MQQLFFFDIDGTLAHHGVVPEENRRAVEQLRSRGNLTFICTGRPFFYAYARFGDLVDGIIAHNGRHGSLHGKTVYERPLSLEEVTFYRDAFTGFDCPFAFLGKEFGYISGYSDEEVLKKSRGYGGDHFFVSDWKAEDVNAYSFDIYYRTNEQFRAIHGALDDHLVFNDHVGHFSADVTTRVFDKGHGITAMREALGLKDAKAYAFGDGWNDVCMFRAVDTSIAMGNAVDETKAAADYITLDYDKGGIPQALHHFGIL